MSSSELVSWGVEILKVVIDEISEAAKGPEPPSSDVLNAKIVARIEARHEDWVKEAKRAGDQALFDAAAAEFSDEMQKLVAPKK